MPTLSTRSFSAIVNEQARAAQAAAAKGAIVRSLDFTVGSVFRALAEANATIALWMQGLVLRALANTRAATSSGDDLTSWMADFNVVRLAGQAATGDVVFGRFTPALTAFVPVGALVRTTDGVWTYRVTADSTRPSWTVTGSGATLRQGYTIPPGTGTITIPVASTAPGVGANADPGSISLLATSVAGVDYVRNDVPMRGGTEEETDAQLKVRFRAYIASLPSAVRRAIDYAISQVQPGLSWNVLEATRPDGTPAPAYFTVVLDDGTGAPPANLLSRVSAAVETQRALGVSYAVIGPDKRLANVTMSLTVSRDADQQTVVANVSAAIRAHIAGLPLGASLSFTRLSVIAYGADDAVVNIPSVALNGLQADMPATVRMAIRPGVLAISGAPASV